MKSIGKYDQRVTFQNMGYIDDGAGGTYPDFVDLLTTFARVEQVSTYTAIEQLQITEGKVKRFFIKKRNGFEPDQTMRIKYKNEFYTIIGPRQVDNERISLEWTMMGSVNTTNNGG